MAVAWKKILKGKTLTKKRKLSTLTPAGGFPAPAFLFTTHRGGTMSDEDYNVNMSELSQTIRRGEFSVQVDIYEAQNGSWILEVIDKYNNSTVWDDTFATDQEALDEVNRTISEEGIESLIGPFDD